MTSSPALTADLFYGIRDNIFGPCALLAASQLDLFTALKDGSRTPVQLAAAIGAKPDKLRMLLNVLVQAGLLERHGDAVANTPESQHFLARGSPGYRGEWWRLDLDLWQALLKTATTLRTGEPQGWHDFASMSEAAMTEFFAGLHVGSVTTGTNLAIAEDFGTACHLLDVGGGSGAVAIGACQAISTLRATVLDLPRIVPIAAGFIAQAGLADRIGTLAHDITCDLPPVSFDLAVLRAVIQVLSPQDARAALQHIGQAMSPGGRILIVGHVLDDARLTPPTVVNYNLVFLNIYRDGEAYTEGEYRAWLTEAGFIDIDVRLGTMPMSTTLIVARRPT